MQTIENILKFGEKCPMDDMLKTLTDYAGINCIKYCKTCNGISYIDKYVICTYIPSANILKK